MGLFLCIAALAACGGGGGGGDDGDEAAEQPASQASAAAVPDAQAPTSPASVSAASSAKFTLSGSLTASGGNIVDSDVNDPLASYADNGSPTTAQFVPTPATVGGYLNVPGAGPEGRSRADGDVTDYYQVALAAGQSLLLYIGSDGVTGDLDLFLTDLDGNQVYTSDGRPIRSITDTDFEILSAEVTGIYLAVVSAHAGAARYVLTVGHSLGPAEAAEPRYVAGDLLVRLDQRARVLGGDWLGSAMAQSLGMSADGGGLQPTLRFAMNSGVPRARYWEDFGLGHLFDTAAVPTDPDPERQLLLDTPLLAKALTRQGWVESVDLNYLRAPDLTPDDPDFPRQWHYRQINLPQAWDSIPPSSDTIVAVADTGFMLAHPDLAGQFVDGYDFVSSPASAADGDGIDPDPTDPGDHAVPGASSYHGTHVAGTIAAATDNGIGVAGVAPNAKMMPLRVLGRHGASDYDLIQALRYSAGLSNNSGRLPARRADVINLSLGGPGQSQVLDDALAEVRDAGVIIVASAGNSSTNAPHYPAASPGVISVSALDADDILAPYSNFGSSIDVVAPGGNLRLDRNGDGEPDGVLSTLVDDRTSPPTPTYRSLQGTSMASPHVAGVIALMLSIRPGTTPEEMDAYLSSGIMTSDIGAPGRDDLYGHGRIDAFKAVNAAAFGPPPPPPELTIDPPALNFSVTGDERNGPGCERRRRRRADCRQRRPGRGLAQCRPPERGWRRARRVSNQRRPHGPARWALHGQRHVHIVAELGDRFGGNAGGERCRPVRRRGTALRHTDRSGDMGDGRGSRRGRRGRSVCVHPGRSARWNLPPDRGR